MRFQFKKRMNRRFSTWVEKRIPADASVTLDQSRIFIVPTMQGLLLLVIAALVLLLAINFESALNYALAFWLIAMLWVAVHLTYRNLSGLTISAHNGTLVKVGDTAEVGIKLHAEKSVNRGVIELIHEQWGAVQAPMDGNEFIAVLPLQSLRRGPVRPPRFRIESRFPFGLVVAWSNVQIKAQAWAYPEGKKLDRKSLSTQQDEEQESMDDHFISQGNEDFHSLRNYVPGDPIQRLHWPGFSRDQLLIKTFTDYQSADEFIDWNQFPSVDAEARLAAIAQVAEEFYRQNKPFALRMPGIEISVNKGDDHLNRVHRALAEFGYE